MKVRYLHYKREVGSMPNKWPVLSWCALHQSNWWMKACSILLHGTKALKCYTATFWANLLKKNKRTRVGERQVCRSWLITCKLILQAHVYLPAVPVSAGDKQHSRTGSALPSVLTDRHLHCLPLKTRGVRCNRCRCQAEDMLCFHSLAAVSLLGSEGASCPFTHSVSPICQAPFHPLPQATYAAPPWSYCPFSLTPATCHWKESITLSAHSGGAAKRPVWAIKNLSVE